MEEGRTWKTISVSNHTVGEQLQFDRKALLGYKAEKEIKRLINANIDKISLYLLSAHGVPETVKYRIEETEEQKIKRKKYKLSDPYDYFTSVELLKDGVTNMPSKNCLKATQIFEEKGMESMIDYLLKISPIIYDESDVEEVQDVSERVQDLE